MGELAGFPMDTAALAEDRFAMMFSSEVPLKPLPLPPVLFFSMKQLSTASQFERLVANSFLKVVDAGPVM